VLSCATAKLLRDEAESMVSNIDPEPGLSRQLFDAERIRVLGVDVLQDPGNPGEVLVPTSQGTQGPALLALEHAIDDFTDCLAAENAAVERGLQALEEPDDGPAQLRAHRGRRDSPRRRADRRRGLVHLEHHLAEHGRLDVDGHEEQGLLGARLRLALRRHRHRQNQIIVCVVSVERAAEIGPLPALADDEDLRLIDHRGARHRLRDARHLDTFDERSLRPLVYGHLVEKAGEPPAIVTRVPFRFRALGV